MNRILSFLIKFSTEIFETISLISYDLLVVAGLIGLILYIFGYEKGKELGMICPALYIILQIIVKAFV